MQRRWSRRRSPGAEIAGFRFRSRDEHAYFPACLSDCRLPRAFLPLRHAVFRTLWLATLASNIGMWVQNTGAGWLMTSLDPAPLMVSLVQAASMLPVFLLALPAGALADIIDRRIFLIGAQAWVLAMALLLAALTASGSPRALGAAGADLRIGAGSAMNFPPGRRRPTSWCRARIWSAPSR